MSTTNICMLFGLDNDNKNEYVKAVRSWENEIVLCRDRIPEYCLVVARYACLPFYDVLERSIKEKGSHLINSYRDHRYVADMKWYHDLVGMTPRTWFSMDEVPENLGGYVVKGRTYSRKFDWNRLMFVDSYDDLQGVVGRLEQDPLIKNGGLAVREYVPLKSYGTHHNKLPISEEWRCFFVGSTLVDAGFYWSQVDIAEDRNQIPTEALDLATEAATCLFESLESDTPFFTVDVAQTKDGNFLIIDINDGQYAGLRCINETTFYSNLKEILCNVPENRQKA